MDQYNSWFSEFRNNPLYKRLQERPIAYFSAEFAISPRLPIYAGGLGVLAGDVVKEACDQSFPMIGVGLFYREGYVCQKVDPQGNIIDACEVTIPQDVGLTPVVDNEGKRIVVHIPIQDHAVAAVAWMWQQGTVPVYLLDTNIDENNTSDRNITDRLYSLDKEIRLKQEMILGIGGIRLLEKLGIHPLVYHLNEGHSAMLILDLIRHEMEKRKINFKDALSLAKRHVIFTNHTLLSSGHEVFSNDLVSTMLQKYSEEISVPTQDIVGLGLIADSSEFSMTMLSLRVAKRSNAVSVLHQQKAKEIWTEHPMNSVTNGVHIPTWDGGEGRESLWEYHQHQKVKLLSYIAEHAKTTWGENELIIGWARRIVSYKRPLALFDDLERLKKIVSNAERPVRIVVSGFAPPGEVPGIEMLKKLEGLAKHELAGTLVYLPHYDLTLAKLMVSGTDVWVNTPVVGFEACGTSSMKAALNGSLPVTTKDGWAYEAELFKVGWVVDTDNVTQSSLDILEKQILPLYYSSPFPNPEWVAHMENGHQMVENQFSATRMLKDYTERMYLPVLDELDH